ncbi:hypothetical protein D3C80_734300 [compost metagenome]
MGSSLYCCFLVESATANELYTKALKRLLLTADVSFFVRNAASANFLAFSRCLKSPVLVYKAKLLLPSFKFDWAATVKLLADINNDISKFFMQFILRLNLYFLRKPILRYLLLLDFRYPQIPRQILLHDLLS